MEVTSLYGSSSTSSTDLTTGTAGGELGKDEFMQMLVTQMQNQDPMDPVDNSEMTAQLAQFSALEQMEDLNGQFEDFQQSSTVAMSMLNAGKDVALELSDGTTVEGQLEKVSWLDGQTQFVVSGETYSSGNVISMRALESAEETAVEP